MRPTIHYNRHVEHETVARKPEQQPVCGLKPRNKRDEILVTSNHRFVNCPWCCEEIY